MCGGRRASRIPEIRSDPARYRRNRSQYGRDGSAPQEPLEALGIETNAGLIESRGVTTYGKVWVQETAA